MDINTKMDECEIPTDFLKDVKYFTADNYITVTYLDNSEFKFKLEAEKVLNSIQNFPETITVVSIHGEFDDVSFLEKIPNLKSLCCQNLVGRTGEDCNIHLLNLPQSLTEIYIENSCVKSFGFLSKLENLKKLEFWDVDDLQSLKKGDLPKSLKELQMRLGYMESTLKEEQWDILEGLDNLEYFDHKPHRQIPNFHIPPSVKFLS